jgi:hypothetical protein
MQALYPYWSFGFATIVGLGAIAAVIVIARKERQFLVGKFWLWLLVGAGLSVANPLLMAWDNPAGVSLEDVFLIRRSYPGLAIVLTSYAILLGVAIGGVVAMLLRGKS